MNKDRRRFIRQVSAIALAIPLANHFSIAGAWGANSQDFLFASKYYRIGLCAKFPFIQYLSVDSLGTGRLNNNPVLPPGPDAVEYELRRINDTKVGFHLKSGLGGDPIWTFTFTEKNFTITSRYSENSKLPIRFIFNEILNHATLLGMMEEEKKTKLPALLHLPDLGSFRVFSDDPGTVVDYDANRDVPQPFISMAFPAATRERPVIRYTFETTAIYPAFPGSEQSKNDAYRRNYINIFQISPVVQGFANNSCSDACSFTLYFSSIMALHTPPIVGKTTALDLLRMSLERYVRGMKSYGLVGYQAWHSIYNSLDAFPSLVISACNYIIGSKDLEWARKNYLTVKGWLDEQMKRDLDHDGLVSYELSGNSGSWDKLRPSNWWDTIGFGHDDAYSNALTFNALKLFVAVSAKLGKTSGASEYKALADKLKDAYFRTFYNPATGILAGWRSEDGKLHDYYFLFVNSIAIYFDLVPAEKQKGIMEALWAKMQAVGLTDYKYGLPGNLVSVRYEDYMHHVHQYGGGQKEDGSDAFQIYENGGLSANYVYFTLMAFKKVGLEAYFDKIIADMLPAFDAGEFQGSCRERTKDWKDWSGGCWGYEGLLCDGYLTFLAMNPAAGQLPRF